MKPHKEMEMRKEKAKGYRADVEARRGNWHNDVENNGQREIWEQQLRSSQREIERLKEENIGNQMRELQQRSVLLLASF